MIAFVFRYRLLDPRRGRYTMIPDLHRPELGCPQVVIGAAVATQLISARITSSPGPTPNPDKPMCIAPVQDEVAMACFTPRYF